MAAEPVVSIRDLSFRHAAAALPALRGVTLDVAPGEYVGIVGPNGSGKTTLALSLNGVVPRLLAGERTGSVRVAGRDPADTPVRDVAALVGIVFDDPSLQLSRPTVADEVAFGLENLGVAWAEMDRRIGESLAWVGLGGFDGRDPATLSGGEQQRLAIACVLAMRPSILVMDEPLSNLDPAGSAAVLELARRLNRDEGMTVIVAEHDVEALAEHAGRIVVLEAGRVALDGPPGAVFGDVDALRRIGVRAPQVTELCAALERAGGGAAGRTRPLPVTVDEAAAWLGGRA